MSVEEVTHTHVLGVPIEYGPVPTSLPDPELAAESVQASGATVIVTVAGARLLVEGGNRVVIDPGPNYRPEDLHWLAYGWAAQVLKIQRHRFCLHASSVAVDGVAYVITGRSGAGKSTTSYALIREGWTPLVDDVSEIDPGPPMCVVPYLRPIQLTSASIQRWGELGEGQSSATTRGKWVVPGGQGTDRVRLGAVIVVELDEDQDAAPVVERMSPLEGFAALKGYSRLQGIAELSSHRAAYLAWLQGVSQAPVFRITRPGGRESLPEVLDAVHGIREAIEGRGHG